MKPEAGETGAKGSRGLKLPRGKRERSQVPLYLLARELGRSEYLGHQTAPQTLPCVDWYNACAPIRMSEVVVATFDADDFETGALEGRNELLARDAGRRVTC